MTKELLESERFVVTILTEGDSLKLSTYQIQEALENYITRTKGLRAGVDFFAQAVKD